MLKFPKDFPQVLFLRKNFLLIVKTFQNNVIYPLTSDSTAENNLIKVPKSSIKSTKISYFKTKISTRTTSSHLNKHMERKTWILRKYQQKFWHRKTPSNISLYCTSKLYVRYSCQLNLEMRLVSKNSKYKNVKLCVCGGEGGAMTKYKSLQAHRSGITNGHLH